MRKKIDGNQCTDLSRREFLKKLGLAGLFAGGTIAGLSEAEAFPSLSGAYSEKYLQKFKKYKEGQRIPTICPYCSVGCGLVVTVIDGRAVEISGDASHPINEGALCSKGAAYLQLVNNERRLKYPMKRKNPKKGVNEDPMWEQISWDEAWNIIAEKVKEAHSTVKYKDEKGNYYAIGKDSPIGWHGSSYWNNEECYLGKKLMSLLGSLNIEHQARKCHASTVMGLANTFGFGAQTNHYIDVKNAKCFLLMSNPAENHPMIFRWIERAKENGAKLIYLDPRFGRSLAYADIAANFRPGTDVAIYLGIARYALFEKPDRVNMEFLEKRTNAPYKTDGTKDENWRESPESIFKKLKEIVANYTPAEVSRITGIPESKFVEIAETFTGNKPGTVLYAMGVTQHTNATHMIRAMAIMQLVLGNIGVPGGGINALRGISNVQGSTDMNMLSHLIMGYRVAPRNIEDVRRYQKWKNGEWDSTNQKWVRKADKRGGNAEAPEDETGLYKPKNKIEERWDARMFPTWNSLEYNWGIFVGTYPGKEPEKEPVICDLPLGTGNATVQLFRAINDGKIKVMFIMGENNAVSNANSLLVKEALSKGVFVVCFELFDHETAHFADILLPATVEIEREGSITNSGRWVQWRWKAVEPSYERKNDFEFLKTLFEKIRAKGVKLPSERFKEEKGIDVGSNPDACWPSPYGKTVRDVYREIGATKLDPAVRPGKVTEQPAANVLYKTSYDAELAKEKYPDTGGILAMRRDIKPASEYDKKWGLFKNWGWSWMLNQRILYNLEEEPKGLNTFFCWWATSKDVFLGLDKAALWSKPLYDPASVEKLITDGKFKGTKEQHPVYHGFPLHNEPVESPVPELAQKYPTIWDERFSVKKGTPEQYPCVLTTFRLVEHMQAGAMTRNLPWLVELHPEMFVELSRSHAARIGIEPGEYVKITTERGSITVKAVVTDRINPLSVAGKDVDIVAMPWHWGFKGLSKGPSANDLTIDAVDIHANIPETKAALCKVEKA